MATNSDDSVVIGVDMSITKAEKKLRTLTSKIEDTEQELGKLYAERDAEKNNGALGAAELDAEKAKLADLKKQLQEMKETAKDKTLSPDVRQEATAGIPQLQTDISDQQERVRALQAEWNKTETAVEKYNAKIEKAEETLEKQKGEAGELAEGIAHANSVAGRFQTGVADAGKQVEKLGTRLKRLASRVLVFSVFTSALRGAREWLGNVVKSNDEASQAVARLKGALLTLIQPLVNVIIPAFTQFVNVLTSIVAVAASLISSLFGTTVEASAEAAENLYEEQKALSGVGNAAKKSGKSIASFDEINKLSSNDSSGSTSSTNDPKFETSSFAGNIEQLQAIMAGALLALGAMLTFSGANIPLGLGLMAVGAATLAKQAKENWGEVETALSGSLGQIMAVIGGALFALGAILAFSGANIPLGIGLMVAGAATLATVAAVNWDSITGALQGSLGQVLAIIGSALLALGAILTFSGVNIPAGIALMAAGAAALAPVIAVNWDALPKVLQEAVWVIVGVLSAALLALGAVMLFTGANIPLGVGLIIAGAAGLASAVAINWDSIKQALTGSIGAVVGLLSGAALVLGAILTFTGANIPLGIGLMVAGAVGLATSIAANWDTISTALEGPVGTVVAIISGALLALGAILLFTGANIPLGLGLLIAGGIGLATSIAANWDTITETLGSKIEAVGAVASAALLVLGIILLFTGAGIPLGIGLLAAGAVGLAATVAPNWDFVLEAIKGAWENVKTWWSANAEKFFTLEYWKDLGKNMIAGLLDGLKGIFTGLSGWASDVWKSITGAFSSNNAKSSISGSALGKDIAITQALNSIPPMAVANVPRLATGAVIPPNREFMAVLGDQTSGMNIETPEGLLRQIVREENGDYTSILREILQAIKDGKMLMVDNDIFAQVVREANERESNRQGVPLVTMR